MNYTVKLVGEHQPESIMAEKYTISPEGDLRFQSGQPAVNVAVFARGQWQFVRN